MEFLLLILLVLFLMIGIPLLRGWFYLQGLKRRVNETFGGRRQQERPQHDDDDEEYTETGERKIYTSGEGEYADFEEVSCTVTEETTTDGDSRVIIEEQVTDAEFEEVRD